MEEASLLAVVNHQKKSSIEFFLIFPDFVNFSNQDDPTLFWVGCVKAPEVTTYFNDVVISNKDGSFYATHQYDKDLGFYRLFLMNIFKLNTGYVYIDGVQRMVILLFLIPKNLAQWHRYD